MLDVTTVTVLEVISTVGIKGAIKLTPKMGGAKRSDSDDNNYYFFMDKQYFTSSNTSNKLSRDEIQIMIDDLSKIRDLIDTHSVTEKLTVN